MNSQNKYSAYLGLLVTFVLWGSLYVASQVVLQELPPFTVAFLRFVLAWLFLTILTRLQKSDAARPNPDASCRKYIWFLGFFGYTISVGIQLLGTKLAGATTASLINSLNPVTISLMAAFFLKEALTPRKGIGILLTVAGAYLIIGTNSSINLTGAGFSLLAVLGWSLVSVLTRKALAAYHPLYVTRRAIGVAALCNLPICLIELYLTDARPSLSLPLILCLLYMGICGTGIPYILWNKSLAALPAGVCSAFYPIQPLTSALLGILLFRERLTPVFAAGTFCIFCGILLCLVTVTPAVITRWKRSFL